jgi:hypothetical protein
MTQVCIKIDYLSLASISSLMLVGKAGAYPTEAQLGKLKPWLQTLDLA